MRARSLIVPVKIWTMTWEGLRTRSRARYESACVWGGRRSDENETVEQVHFLDDLPGVRRHRSFHRTSREATQALFARLHSLGQSIVADVHSHPTEWVGLSETDAGHPIEYRVGLFALVLPRFAIGAPLLSRVGVHIYLGDGEWQELSAAKAKLGVKIV
jgi:hypothetical protein